MWAQVLRVKTLRMKGLLSPAGPQRVNELSSRRNRRQRLRTVARDHTRYLDDWIFGRLGEDTLSARAFNVVAQDPKRRDLGPFAIRGV